MNRQKPTRSLLLLVLFVCLLVSSWFFFRENHSVHSLNLRSEIPPSKSVERAPTSNASVVSRGASLPTESVKLSGYQTELRKPPLVFTPLVFLIDSVKAEEFSVEEDAIIYEIQQSFTAQMASCSDQDPASVEYRKCWSKAQRTADNLLRLRLGATGFNRFNSLAAEQIEKEKSAEQR